MPGPQRRQRDGARSAGSWGAIKACLLTWVVGLNCSAFAAVWAAPEEAVGLATNGTELQRLLTAERVLAQLDERALQHACHRETCFTTWQDWVITSHPVEIRSAAGQHLQWVLHAGRKEPQWPRLDASPLAGYWVASGGQRWGACLEFAHAGLGKSGSAQRWTSVVLIADGSHQAHRFVGYWAGCDSLVQGGMPGQIELPAVRRSPDSGLSIAWHRCHAKTCDVRFDARLIEPVQDDPAGALVVATPR